VGAAIEFQGGRCLLTRGLTLLGDRTYTGESTTGTVLQQAGSVSYILASSAYVNNSTTTGIPLSIRDLTVSCDGSGSTNGIVLLNWHVDVENVDVSGCGGSGIIDTNTNARGDAITNTSVNSRFENNFITNSGRYGFEVHDTRNSVTDGFLVDNQIASSGLDAIHLDNAAGWYISGNNVYGVGQNAISADRLYGTTISSNYIEDFGDEKTSGTWYGILGSVQGGPGSTILGNKIFTGKPGAGGGKYICIGITQVNYGIGHLSVTGNVIVGNRNGEIGIWVSGGSNKLDVSTHGNQVSEVGAVLADGRNVTFSK
jgi:Right handed beta helix region